MTPERWQQVKTLLAAVLETDPSQRSDYLDKSCGGDPSLREDVENLLALDEETNAAFLNAPAKAAILPEDAVAQNRVGLRIGPYQIVEEIGAGGMGEVYRAFRADDQFRRQVAIKLVRAGYDSGFVVSRFKNERQILASLDHPNIARLHDGGTTAEGLPYFVMELIEGEPIDQYCAGRDLAVADRLKLFLQVCSAVQYAHQRLIIHRDIKPGNILVAADGTPKLLDFGIAKILDSEAAGGIDATATVFRVFTPGYASPEQVKGEPITTASDVYSLGVVLYELLTGHHPYSRLHSTPQEIARAVCEVEPPKPSAAIFRPVTSGELTQTSAATQILHLAADKKRKLLRGDLDNIVLMALRKDPQRRYASVEQFAEDIRRHLQNLPVHARKDTVGYRASKFVARHKVGISAAVAVVLILLISMAVTLRQARIARQERARAERRFNDVRKLANSLIFEIHDSIEHMPGATPTRKLLLERALEYLDSLAKEASGDYSLQRELAAAYLRIGSLQGSTLDASLGQPEDALTSFKKAVAIREAVAAANPTNDSDQLNLAVALHALGRMLDSAGKPGAREQVDKALAITDRLVAHSDPGVELLGERSTEYELLSDLQSEANDATGCLNSMKMSLAITQELRKAHPLDRRHQRGAAIGSVKVAYAMTDMGLRTEALPYYRTGLDLFEDLAKDQNDARTRRELAVATFFRAVNLAMNGDSVDSLADNQRGLAILEPMAAADPQNVTLQLDRAGALGGMGRDLVILGRYTEAQNRLQQSVGGYEAVLGRDPADQQAPRYMAASKIWIAEALVRSGKPQSALPLYNEAIASLDRYGDVPDLRSEAAAANVDLARAFVTLGRTGEAGAAYRKALSIAEPFATANPPNVRALYAEADAYFGLGELSRMAAAGFAAGTPKNSQHWTEARDWYRKSSEAWSKIPNPAAITPSGFPCGNPKTVAEAVAKSNVALTGSRSSP